MTKKDCVALGLRLMALVALLVSARTFESRVFNSTLGLGREQLTQIGWLATLVNQGMGQVLLVFGPLLVMLVLVLVLWLGADGLAAFLARRSDPNAESTLLVRADASEVLGGLLAVLGLYLLVTQGFLLGSALWSLFVAPPSTLSILEAQNVQAKTLLGLSTFFTALGAYLAFGGGSLLRRLPATRQFMKRSPLLTVKNLGRDPETALRSNGSSSPPHPE